MSVEKSVGGPLREGLLYDRNSSWVLAEGDACRFGLTEPAVRKAREVAFAELPRPGDNLRAGKPCGMMECVKWSGEIA